jgi:hypothetical protein
MLVAVVHFLCPYDDGGSWMSTGEWQITLDPNHIPAANAAEAGRD